MCIRAFRGRNTSGTTLVEFLFAIAIGMIAIAALASLSLYSGRTFAGLMNYADLENRSRAALDLMTKEIRQTSLLTDSTTNQLTFTDYDGASLVYQYSPTNQTLTRTKNGASKVLLTGCETLRFAIFQRNSINGTYDQYPSSSQPTNTKLVQISWVCKRSILGASINSESVQTAKIVIRKK